MNATTERIDIARPPGDVFALLCDPRHLAAIHPHTSVTSPLNGPLSLGARYTRVLRSHGLPNRQTVVVTVCTPPHDLVTETTLLGCAVRYRYTLSAEPSGVTTVTLVREVERGWRRLHPLVMHLLTRPEHDGDHLPRLKALVEASPHSRDGPGTPLGP